MSARRSGLGRGLGALIPVDPVSGSESGDLLEIDLDEIDPNPGQPRTVFAQEALDSLAASIAEVGVLQPILVRRRADGRWELVAGERRWRAARQAGLGSIPAIVREVDDEASVEQALIENLHREDLNPLEEAAAYQQLIGDFGLTQEAVAKRVGKSRVAVANTIRLLQLPPGIQRLVGEGKLSAGHARALLGTSDRAFAEALAKRIAQEGWTVRAVEDAVRARQSEPDDESPAGSDEPATPPARRLPPPGLAELEHLLAEHLQTRVSVAMAGSRGKVVIEFADLEDLERIYRTMVQRPMASAEADQGLD